MVNRTAALTPNQQPPALKANVPTETKAEYLRFQWKPQPEAQRMVDSLIDELMKRNAWMANLAERMKNETGTRFKDWVDHIAISFSDPLFMGLRERMIEVGFSHRPMRGAANAYIHRGGIFPEILLGESKVSRIAIKVDSVSNFVEAHQLSDADIHGRPYSQKRTACVAREENCELWVYERHGLRGYESPEDNPTPIEKCIKAQEHLEKLCRRRRDYEHDEDGFHRIDEVIGHAIADLGRDWTCDLFFEAERRYWMQRNRAAQVQYGRQSRLGLGWANHDHHTYRASRKNFTQLIAVWEKLGFNLRERFYAGHEAQWGAQVLEQPATGITTFNDVDMSPEELMGDFSHIGFTDDRDRVGTVGLWCGLHGDSILQAGMHHLECQFDFHALVAQLDKDGHVKHMAPFTTFPYLRQAFTEGERWNVNPKRVDRLLAAKMIDEKQATLFRNDGAIGSHLENLERNDGFKGFNQQGVSDIILRTDARRVAEEKAKKVTLGA